MRSCFWLLPLIASFLTLSASAKDKKGTLPEYVLRAQTVLVVVDPDVGEPLDQPNANATARENVEKALTDWGRFRLVMDGGTADLIISVRTGTDRMVRPTVKGGPIDQRPGIGQSTDDTVRIGAQHGQPPPLTDPTADPQNQGPHMSNEIGSSDDTFAVYRGELSNPLDAPPVWRYIMRDCLHPTPQVPAVEEFRKAIVEAEKAKNTKKP